MLSVRGAWVVPQQLDCPPTLREPDRKGVLRRTVTHHPCGTPLRQRSQLKALPCCPPHNTFQASQQFHVICGVGSNCLV